jgi:predicted nucleotidyltransferase
LAVESGSRAWGFASPDSDYDVRFIYVHQRAWYLTVFESRDVVEAMLPGDLDLSGWDLRKALRLFSKCNLGLNEWLGSPIVYSEVSEFAAQLRQLLPRYFNPIAATHHYRSMADASLKEHAHDGRIGIKKLFHVLRPLLACRWIAATCRQPPTEFAALVAADWVTAEERSWIAELLQQKAQAVEAEQVPLAASRIESIRGELDHYKAAANSASAPLPPELRALDAVLQRWVGD